MSNLQQKSDEMFEELATNSKQWIFFCTLHEGALILIFFSHAMYGHVKVYRSILINAVICIVQRLLFIIGCYPHLVQKKAL